MSQRKLDKGIILIGLIVLILAVLGVFVFFQVRIDEISARTLSGNDVPVLLVVENDGKLILSHVILVHPKTKRLALIDIPTNLGAIIDTLKRVDSVENLYREKGFEAYVSYLEKLLDIDLPFHIRMDLVKVAGITDFLKGVTVFVPDSIDVKTDDGKLIRIPNGVVNLDGDKVREYLSYETANEREQERSNRRWAFSKGLLSILGSRISAVADTKYMAYMTKFLNGNMDEKALQTWAGLLTDVNFESMLNQKILGNTRNVETVGGNKTLLFPHFDGQLARDSIRQVSSNLASADDGKDGSPIRIEILNGTDLPGIARKAKDLYVNYGFEVVRFGNASTTTQDRTQVIDRRGNLAVAERTAKIIKCESISTQLVAQGADPASEVDVTIMLGKDFDGWYVKR